MSGNTDMAAVFAAGARAASVLMAQRQSVAVAEGATGGLVSAALLAVPGASACYLGGAIIYTPRARHRLLGLRREDVIGIRSASQPWAMLAAETVRQRFSATWGIAESGAAGPKGNPYGDAAGHSCIAVAGPAAAVRTLATGSDDRIGNMAAFAVALLELLVVQAS